MDQGVFFFCSTKNMCRRIILPGNRARWIGFGTLLIAISQLMTASPNFIFPVTTPRLSLKEIEVNIYVIYENIDTIIELDEYPLESSEAR